jgi:hypothetical protein
MEYFIFIIKKKMEYFWLVKEIRKEREGKSVSGRNKVRSNKR